MNSHRFSQSISGRTTAGEADGFSARDKNYRDEYMSRYLEEFQPGEVLLSPGRTITEADAARFAALTGDTTGGLIWSGEQGGETAAGFAGRAAQETLIFSASTGLATGHDPSLQPDLIAFFGVERIRFLERVNCGDTIRLRQTVESAQPINERSGLLTMNGEIITQNESIALRYTAKLLVRRRPRPVSSPAE